MSEQNDGEMRLLDRCHVMDLQGKQHCKQVWVSKFLQHQLVMCLHPKLPPCDWIKNKSAFKSMLESLGQENLEEFICVGHDLCGRRLTSSVRIAQSLDPAISPRFRHPACRKISESRDANCAKGMVNENYLDFAMDLWIMERFSHMFAFLICKGQLLAQKQNGCMPLVTRYRLNTQSLYIAQYFIISNHPSPLWI